MSIINDDISVLSGNYIEYKYPDFFFFRLTEVNLDVSFYMSTNTVLVTKKL